MRQNSTAIPNRGITVKERGRHVDWGGERTRLPAESENENKSREGDGKDLRQEKSYALGLWGGRSIGDESRRRRRNNPRPRSGGACIKKAEARKTFKASRRQERRKRPDNNHGRVRRGTKGRFGSRNTVSYRIPWTRDVATGDVTKGTGGNRENRGAGRVWFE